MIKMDPRRHFGIYASFDSEYLKTKISDVFMTHFIYYRFDETIFSLLGEESYLQQNNMKIIRETCALELLLGNYMVFGTQQWEK